MSPERRRLALALLLSLLIHALLLSLTFGDQEHGLPGFGFPWQDRRIEVPDLRVVLVPAQVTATQTEVSPVAEPLRQAWIEPPAAHRPTPTPAVSVRPTPGRSTAATAPETDPPTRPTPTADARNGAVPANATSRADRPRDIVPPPIPEPPVIALARPDAATRIVPATPAVPMPAIAAEPGASSPETAMPPLRDAGDGTLARIDQEAQERAAELARLDRAKLEAQAEQLNAARRDAARLEAARAQAARLEAERQEAARQAEVRQEAARQEASRQELALAETKRLEAERQEAARQAEVRQELARQEASRQELAREEATRLEAERQEAARQGAARVEAARAEAAQEAAARREAKLRAIGRQLDEEAAQREAVSAAARPSPSLAPSSGSPRRGRLFGRTDPNAELILYAEAWGRKIQLNMTFDMVREVAKQPHTDPLVTVAVRSDGSVESVTFVRSSGVAAIDEAIRRVVQSQVPYQAFPPGLAREFDVIEIRRTWYFDTAIRLY